MGVDLQTLRSAILFDGLSLIFSSDDILIYEYDKPWNKKCDHIVLNPCKSRCVTIFVREGECMMSVPGVGGCFPSTNDEVVGILIDMIKK
jgi:hypothetical protein